MSVYFTYIGHNGGYGSAGLGLGPRYGNGGMKGPNKGRNIFEVMLCNTLIVIIVIFF